MLNKKMNIVTLLSLSLALSITHASPHIPCPTAATMRAYAGQMTLQDTKLILGVYEANKTVSTEYGYTEKLGVNWIKATAIADKPRLDLAAQAANATLAHTGTPVSPLAQVLFGGDEDKPVLYCAYTPNPVDPTHDVTPTATGYVYVLFDPYEGNSTRTGYQPNDRL